MKARRRCGTARAVSRADREHLLGWRPLQWPSNARLLSCWKILLCEVMLVNAKTGKCLTIAGGESTDNNVRALQFNCDTDLSRRWTIRLKL